MKYSDKIAVNKILQDIRPSHNEPFQIKAGAQMGMWEKEVSNYAGYGPPIKVYGQTAKEAENLAAQLCDIIKAAHSIGILVDTGK